MHITMIKKRMANGDVCRKCAQAEELLRARGLWHKIDEVVWAEEADPSSAGTLLAARFGIEFAPFFVVDNAGSQIAYGGVLKFIKEVLEGVLPSGDPTVATAVDAPSVPLPGPSPKVADCQKALQSRGPAGVDIDLAARELAERHPSEILRWGLERWGSALGIAFSGAEDVVLLHMASQIGLPFSVFCLDTGRLHPETYRFIDAVRRRYEIEITMTAPNTGALEAFVKRKGLFSFYDDGHGECCGVRKVEPLRRVLGTLRAWATGQRRDQSPATRSGIAVVEMDRAFSGAPSADVDEQFSAPLTKLNPLAQWSSAQVWQYIRENDVPFNSLHERGFISIGCEPCTRATLPGQHERAGRWWWEDATTRECGLHIGKPSRHL